MFCSSRPATYKVSIVTTTGTFNNDLSTLAIWSFAASRMRAGCTSLIRDGRDPSSCLRLQDQSRIGYGTLMARRSQTPRISSINAVFTLSQLVSWVVSCSAAWLLKGYRSHTSSTTPFTSSQLVLHAVYCRGIAPILLVLLRLLVLDQYYVQFIAGASLSYFQYYSIY
jgi:hypothetical protein